MRDTLNDMQQYLVDEFVEDYQTGHMTRRDALRRIAAITGSVAMATTILAACGGPAESTATPSASAATAGSPAAASAAASAAAGSPSPAPTNSPDPSVSVAENDPAISAEMIEFPGQDATLMGYLARPAGEGRFPVILVCHENRGLTPHIQDVTRRLAKVGYVGLAVDLLSREGGSAAVTDAAAVPGILGNLAEGVPAQDFQDGLRYVQSQPYADNERSGMVGFCYGGGVTWRAATVISDLRAAVPFYGPPPTVDAVPNIQAAVLAIYAEQDQRINASIPEIEAAMQQNNKTFEKEIYPGVDHAFHNDTGARYNPEQAKAAWARTLAWFEQYVKA